ncbi:aldehyde oxidase 2 [Microcaecilia unicolor]|uniref:aldehyde oxidase n=1 Tax=Microcaecilia unicolor TaxID=1415580 RepID=A0A6P7YLI6_9AMPH|nr:aldehyde oxidase 2-like [Microcaecilia unicolor]
MPCIEGTDELIFYVNGRKIIEKNADPEMMLLNYLRKRLHLTGTKYGCGVGGCGSCTVMLSRFDPVSKKIQHYAVNACLLPICSLYGAAVTTVEGIGSTKTRIHPVQERIAKAHGSQCGFCTPGMVMSMYTLLRSHPEFTMDQIYEALGGNLCRCTGYRPILDGYKTLCKDSGCCQTAGKGSFCMERQENESTSAGNEKDLCTALFTQEEFLPLDPTQELIFPPELMLMAENLRIKKMVFQGERITWISPASLSELLELKVKYPKAPLVVGNTNIGLEMNLKGTVYPVIISPTRIPDLTVINFTDQGLTVGAGCSLATLKDTLAKAVSELPVDKTKIFQALLKQLQTLAGQQIRNMASLGGHIIGQGFTSDLTPVLTVGNCSLNLISKDCVRQVPMDEKFFAGLINSGPKSEEIVLSVHIPYSRKWEFVYAFRQAQRWENSAAIVNAGMRVLFKEGTDNIQDISIVYGGIDPSIVSAKKTSQGLIGRQWNQNMLDNACKHILDEVTLPGSAVGGKVEYKRTLTISFFFKFYLKVLHGLKKMNLPSTHEMPSNYVSAIQDFPTKEHKSLKIYQDVDPGQPCQDPVGRPIVHMSAIKQATGEAVYCDDRPAVDSELFLVFVTSTRAHAKIVSIDKTEALKIPGVVDIVTAEDAPGTNELPAPEYFYAKDKVICVGQVVCAVLADTIDHAKRGAAQVKIVYENLEPVILTPEDAIKHNSYFAPDKKITYGNVEEAFKTADHVLEGEIHIGGQEHFYLETQTIYAIPKGEDHEMDVYVSTQALSAAQEAIAAALGVPSNRIRCHVTRVGGSFGGKTSKPAFLGAAVAIAANKTRRPVRCVLERGDDILITAGRHPFFSKYKLGFMNNGRIVAVDVKYYTNAGCTPDESILVLVLAILKLDNGYHFPNVKCHALACKTNLPSNTAFRGFGFPQIGFITEVWMDTVAARCGLSPEKVREINMYKGISQTYYKQEFDATNLCRCWNECLKKSSYHSRRAHIEEYNKLNCWKKKGIAIIPLKYGVGAVENTYHQAGALVHVYKDGSVLVYHNGVELGQGLNTKIIQITSRELKIPISDIYIFETSTTAIPNMSPTAGSLGTDINGIAVQRACQALMQRLEPIVKQNPEGTWKTWVGAAYLQRISLSATGFYRGYDTEMDWEKGEGYVTPYFVFGAACSEVEIDCLTGAHKKVKVDMVIDVGRSINPGIDVGQIEGAFVQGLGLYTIEELKYSPEGVLYTRGPDQYKIPAVSDIPEEFSVSLLAGSENPYTIYSSKGIGEPTFFLGCSTFFAIKDAIIAARKERGLTGEFTVDSPLTPERIRMACGDQFTCMIPKDKTGSYVPWAINI